MKPRHLLCLATAVLMAVRALALNIPSDGSDGDFSPTGDIVVDLSLAPTGAWDTSSTANAGKGVYDPSKWAVVFKYNSVKIPKGAKVTFINHKTRAPVVWLVKGNVQIDGTVSVAGRPKAADVIGRLVPAEPGPGGFRSGAEGPLGFGYGYGPGGGTVPGTYASTYGNPQILPLIGGSGSGRPENGNNGGAGGGAILIAAAGSVSISGLIDARGGLLGHPNAGFAPDGSGGGVRIITELFSGSGQINALPDGRIRIETPALAGTIRTLPETIAVTPPPNPIIWPADDAPTVRVLTVDGQAAPDDPTAPVASTSDVAVQKNGTVQVVLETKNFPIQGVVQLRTVQKYGPAAWVTAARGAGDFAKSTWVANVTFAPGFTTLQARATVP
jgi:hypothetical protein